MNGSRRLGRLNWLCRRGMKELDLVLTAFVQREQDDLEAGAWPGLERLLETEDDLLWDWLQKPVSSPPEFRPLLESLRRHD
jgi:antitoxin CptB